LRGGERERRRRPGCRACDGEPVHAWPPTLEGREAFEARLPPATMQTDYGASMMRRLARKLPVGSGTYWPGARIQRIRQKQPWRRGSRARAADRSVVSEGRPLDLWPLILIDVHTEDGIVGRSYLEP